MASSKWMNKKWKRKQFTFFSSKLPTGECFAYFAYLHFLVVIWSTLGGIGNAGFVVSRAFNLLQADNLLFCTAWESDPGLITLTFKLCALLDNNHFVIKKIISQCFVQQLPFLLALSVPPICPRPRIDRQTNRISSFWLDYFCGRGRVKKPCPIELSVSLIPWWD